MGLSKIHGSARKVGQHSGRPPDLDQTNLQMGSRSRQNAHAQPAESGPRQRAGVQAATLFHPRTGRSPSERGQFVLRSNVRLPGLCGPSFRRASSFATGRISFSTEANTVLSSFVSVGHRAPRPKAGDLVRFRFTSDSEPSLTPCLELMNESSAANLVRAGQRALRLMSGQ